MGKHFSAVQEFEKNNSYLRSIQKYNSALKSAGDNLLAMQGINKNILGMQSIIEQNRPLMNILSSMSETMKLSSDLSSAAESIRINKSSLKNPLTEMAMGISSLLPSTMANLLETHNRLNSTFQAIIGNQYFLQRISEQSPFISAVQRHTSLPEKIFGNSGVLAQMAESKTLFESALPVVASALNFSSALDSLSIGEQQRIVDILEQIDLDDDSELEVNELNLGVTRTEYIELTTFIQIFFKENSSYMTNILSTIETTIKNFIDKDLSNPFTIIVFAYSCLALLINAWNIKIVSDENNGDDNKND